MLSWLTDGAERDALRRYRAAVAGRDPAGTAHARVGPGRRRVPDVPSEVMARLGAAVRGELGLGVHDEQWMAVLGLLDGRAVELDTGEGKTLVGALAAAIECGRGRRVHVATLNDYLARRDARWMAPVLGAAGLGVASVTSTSSAAERRAAYGADVVYVPLTEVGFDVLRDELVERRQDRVLGGPLDHLIVDEVDALLVDQASIPLVVAGAWDAPGDDLAAQAHAVVSDLRAGADFEVDGARTTAWLTDPGTDLVEARLGVRLADDLAVATAVNVALHARALVIRDVDYLVVDGEVRLIDTSRGRVAHLRRWPDGLQEAVEIREGLARSATGVILNQSTIPALVRQYRSVAGMSGTAHGAREELDALYRLQVVRVPPHRACVRVDEPMRVYASSEQRAAAVVARTLDAHGRGQPVLLGTGSVADSERYSRLLDEAGVPHVVLNAKNDAAEAALVADAGRPGAVTVSTQMAGRGTDIVLGGADGAHEAQVRDAGGLLVLASGLYPSSRLDRQLRGRAGRQGDPGRSAVYAALDDPLITAVGTRAGGAHRRPDRDGRLVEPAVARAVAHAQRVAEGADLDRLRSTWRYHAVVAAHGAVVQATRERLLAADDDLARRTRLAVLDRAWSDHLATLADLRDGIHLRTMARVNPWLSFNDDAEQHFAPLLDDADAAATALLDQHPEATSLAGLGLRRPSSTWSYVLSDMHLGDDLDRALRTLRRAVHPRHE